MHLNDTFWEYISYIIVVVKCFLSFVKNYWKKDNYFL